MQVSSILDYSSVVIESLPMSEFATQETINVDSLIQYLQQQQSKGETHVHIDEQAKLILREFYIRAIGGQSTPDKQVAQQVTQTQAQVTPKVTTVQSSTITTSGTTSADKIQSLKAQAQSSATIKELGTLRDTLVFSAGNPDADVMLIGDAPGYHEEKLQTPFAGPAGKKLDGILKAMGLSREEVYLTYLVKFRPLMENQTTNNRKPTDKEIDVFNAYIEQEVQTIRPKVIVTLGTVASTTLLNVDGSVDTLRGKQHKVADILTRVTYHPSYLLSNDTNTDKRKLWEDMLDVMNDIGIPISEKQQNFFK